MRLKLENKFIFLLSLALVSCGQMQKENRLPSSESDAKVVRQCGEIRYSENNRVARDSEDLMYILHLDCNRDRKIDLTDKNLVIGIPLQQLRLQQKSWLTRWKQQAVRAAQVASANPYLCVEVQAVADPCISGKSVTGTAPIFTSRVSNLQRSGEK